MCACTHVPSIRHLAEFFFVCAFAFPWLLDSGIMHAGAYKNIIALHRVTLNDTYAVFNKAKSSSVNDIENINPWTYIYVRACTFVSWMYACLHVRYI